MDGPIIGCKDDCYHWEINIASVDYLDLRWEEIQFRPKEWNPSEDGMTGIWFKTLFMCTWFIHCIVPICILRPPAVSPVITIDHRSF